MTFDDLILPSIVVLFVLIAMLIYVVDRMK